MSRDISVQDIPEDVQAVADIPDGWLCPVAMLGWVSGVTPALMRSGVIELVMIPPGGSVRPDGGDRGRPATTTS